MKIPPEDRKYWIIGGSIIIATVIHAFAFRYGSSGGTWIDRWTGKKGYTPTKYSSYHYR